jgi:hypothetical protein
MIKKILRNLKIVPIDVFIYVLNERNFVPFRDISFPVSKKLLGDGRVRYFIVDQGRTVHATTLFPKVRLLRLIGIQGPVVGDGITIPEYRGRSMLPFMISYIAKDVFDSGQPALYGVVNRNNASSIRGLDKAGYTKYGEIQAKRFLFWYFGKRTRISGD